MQNQKPTKKFSAAQRKAVETYNLLARYYGRISKMSLELADLNGPDPNQRYYFGNRADIPNFIDVVFDFQQKLSKFNMYDIPLGIFKTNAQMEHFTNQYKIWTDDVDLLYSIALREYYLEQLRNNLRLITVRFNNSITQMGLPYNEVYFVLSSTIFDSKAIQQNLNQVKSFVQNRFSTKAARDLMTTFNAIKSSLKTTAADMPLRESSFDSLFRDTKIKDIKAPSTEDNIGQIKYNKRSNYIESCSKFNRGDTIEIAPVKVLSKDEYDSLESHMPNNNIYFEILKDKLYGLPLGYVPVYDYSEDRDDANAYFRYVPSGQYIKIIALSDIPSNTRIIVSRF